MNTKIKHALLLLIIIATASCKKLLSPDPLDIISPENYYSTEGELQTGLTGVYEKLSSLEIYGNHQSFFLTYTTDEATSRLGADQVANYTYDAANIRISGFWKALYEGIERANLLLANIDKPEMDETKRDIIKGEALFLRAYYYFLLTSNFGNVPLKLSPTSSIYGNDIPATPSKDIYTKIIADMTEAEGLVQDVVKYDINGPADNGLKFAGRVTKSAVQGILARVCLTEAGYPIYDNTKYRLALDWALKVKNSGRHSLNPSYSDVFIKLIQDHYDTKESIWEVEFYGNNTNGLVKGSQALGNLIGILNNTEENSIGFSTAYVRVSKKLYDAYESKNGIALDSRRDWNCPNFLYNADGSKAIQTNVWVFPAGKYRREYELVLPKDKNFSPINFPLLRYSDVLLMIAEAQNALTVGSGPPPQTAVDAVNEVRKRGFGKAVRGEIVTGIAVNTQGSGYVLPTITLSGGGGSGATGTATVVGGVITRIAVGGSGGSNYTSPPTVTITGAGGSGATATATVTDGKVSAIMVTNGGSNYTAVVTISNGGGSGATAVATVTSGRITAITVTNGGSNYTSPPTVTITGAGTNATAATPTLSSLDTDALLKSTDIDTKEHFLTAIKRERSLELCFEALRKADLIRWGVFYETMKDFAAYSDANGGTSIGATPAKNLQQRHLLYPIPSHEIGLNKALVQNVGW